MHSVTAAASSISPCARGEVLCTASSTCNTDRQSSATCRGQPFFPTVYESPLNRFSSSSLASQLHMTFQEIRRRAKTPTPCTVTTPVRAWSTGCQAAPCCPHPVPTSNWRKSRTQICVIIVTTHLNLVVDQFGSGSSARSKDDKIAHI